MDKRVLLRVGLIMICIGLIIASIIAKANAQSIPLLDLLPDGVKLELFVDDIPGIESRLVVTKECRLCHGYDMEGIVIRRF